MSFNVVCENVLIYSVIWTTHEILVLMRINQNVDLKRGSTGLSLSLHYYFKYASSDPSCKMA